MDLYALCASLSHSYVLDEPNWFEKYDQRKC